MTNPKIRRIIAPQALPTGHVIESAQDDIHPLRSELGMLSTDLRHEISSDSALIPSAVYNEVERVTGPAKGLIKKSLQAIVQLTYVMAILKAVMLEDNKVLIVFDGLFWGIANEAVDKRMTK